MGVLKVYDGTSWQEAAVAAGGSPLWSPDVDNPLTALTNITSGSGTWSISGTLQCVTAASTSCKAYDDSGTLGQGTVTMMECEVQVPSSATTGTQFACIGLMDPADITAVGHLPFGGVNFAGGASGAYMEEEGLVLIGNEAYTVPAAGTWVTMRVMLAGERMTLWLDDVKVGEAHAASLGADKNGAEFVPAIKAYSSTGLTIVFRNLKAWSLNSDPDAVLGGGAAAASVPPVVKVYKQENFA